MSIGSITHRRWLFSAILILSCFATSVQGSSRALTPDEAAYYKRVQKILKAALPVPQAPWELIEEEPLAPPTVVKIKFEKNPMYVCYYQVVANRPLEDAIEQRDMKSVTEVMTGEPERMQKMMEEARPKMEAIGQKMQVAATRGDFAEVQRLQKDLEKLQNPMVQASQETQDKSNAVSTLPEGFDGRYKIDLFTVLEDAGNRKFQKAPDVAGLPVFWGTHDHVSKIGDSYDGMYFVFLGPVQSSQTSDGLVMKSVRKNKVGRFAASHLTVIVKGAKAHARQIVEAIDWSQLKALVAQ
jgi:hypothetical protein